MPAEVKSSDPRVIIAEMERATAQMVASLAAEIVHELVVATPVDTGWARSNWIPYVGAVPVAPVGSKDSVSGSRPGVAAATLLTSYRFRQGNITIANNVPYIGLLNDGWSRQAPAGFVEAAVQKAASRFVGVVVK